MSGSGPGNRRYYSGRSSCSGRISQSSSRSNLQRQRGVNTHTYSQRYDTPPQQPCDSTELESLTLLPNRTILPIITVITTSGRQGVYTTGPDVRDLGRPVRLIDAVEEPRRADALIMSTADNARRRPVTEGTRQPSHTSLPPSHPTTRACIALGGTTPRMARPGSSATSNGRPGGAASRRARAMISRPRRPAPDAPSRANAGGQIVNRRPNLAATESPPGVYTTVSRALSRPQGSSWIRWWNWYRPQHNGGSGRSAGGAAGGYS